MAKSDLAEKIAPDDRQLDPSDINGEPESTRVGGR